MIDVFCFALGAYYLVILAYVILSWVPRPPEPFQPIVAGVRALVDPVVRPIRAMLPPLQMGGVGLDLSVLVVFFAILLLRSALCGGGGLF